jgi:hypothetical protein
MTQSMHCQTCVLNADCEACRTRNITSSEEPYQKVPSAGSSGCGRYTLIIGRKGMHCVTPMTTQSRMPSPDVCTKARSYIQNDSPSEPLWGLLSQGVVRKIRNAPSCVLVTWRLWPFRDMLIFSTLTLSFAQGVQCTVSSLVKIGMIPMPSHDGP